MILIYSHYSLRSVYGELDESLRAEIVAFWAKNNAIADMNEAWRRTNEVVFVLRNPAGAIIGISSVYISALENRKYYFYRMFIQPRDRIPGLMRFATLGTRDFLRSLAMPDKPEGMLIVTENVKLMRKGMRRLFEKNGFIHLGRTAAGFDVWKSDFVPPPVS